MLNGNRIIVVLPAYRAESTLEATVNSLPAGIVDEIILVDDAGGDRTPDISRQLGLTTFVHDRNLGYGANQKTCYREALRRNADIVVMVHPDYQYDPRLVTSLVGMIASGVYDVAIGSRMLGMGTLQGGMPLYKFFANRCLTMFQNLLMWHNLSEYHTGYRAFSREVLEKLPLLSNSDDFVFDNEMLAQVISRGYRIGEISCPTKYFEEASSINFWRSMVYGFGVIATSLKYRLWRWGLSKPAIFNNSPTRTLKPYYEDATKDECLVHSDESMEREQCVEQVPVA
jgi:glycosyltransferase involved in cell wall biosynthesis